jgi:hypothetical protein
MILVEIHGPGPGGIVAPEVKEVSKLYINLAPKDSICRSKLKSRVLRFSERFTRRLSWRYSPPSSRSLFPDTFSILPPPPQVTSPQSLNMAWSRRHSSSSVTARSRSSRARCRLILRHSVSLSLSQTYKEHARPRRDIDPTLQVISILHYHLIHHRTSWFLSLRSSCKQRLGKLHNGRSIWYRCFWWQ